MAATLSFFGASNHAVKRALEEEVEEVTNETPPGGEDHEKKSTTRGPRDWERWERKRERRAERVRGTETRRTE